MRPVDQLHGAMVIANCLGDGKEAARRGSIMRARALGICISVLFFLLSVQAGGQTGPQCGGAVTGVVTLMGPLNCPTGHGLIVGDGATLDCAGYTITGSDGIGQYGVYVTGVSNATVQNCIVERFEVGIRLRAATNCTVRNSTTQFNTRYGVEVTQGSTGALIQNNTVANNSDEGIHVSGPTDRDANHTIVENTVDANTAEGIYLLNTNANVAERNTIRNQGAAGVYITGSHRNNINYNTLTNDPIQFVNGSQSNMLTGNTIYGQRIKFDGSSNNEVYSMNIQGQNGVPSTAYDLNNNSLNNRFFDSQALDPLDYYIRVANGSTNNAFTRFSTGGAPLKCFVDSASSVTITDPAGASLFCGSSGDGIHDVEVTAIGAPAAVVQGETVTITVTVANQGTFSETFDVSLQNTPPEKGVAGSIIDTPQTVSLAAGGVVALNFSWGTANASAGAHTLTAMANQVTGEADTADNSKAAAVTVNPPAGGSTIKVQNVSVTLTQKGSGWQGKATATVVDQTATPVREAKVTGDWSLNGVIFQSGASGATNPQGKAQITSEKVNAQSGNIFTFTVTNVSKAGSTWDGEQSAGNAPVP